jgi:hypothetical protein
MVCGVFHVRYTEGAGAGAWFIVVYCSNVWSIEGLMYFKLSN